MSQIDKNKIMDYLKYLYSLESEFVVLASTTDVDKVLEPFVHPLTRYIIKKFLERENEMLKEKKYHCTEKQLLTLSDYIKYIVDDKTHLLHENFILAINSRYEGIGSCSSFLPLKEEEQVNSKKFIAYELIKASFSIFTIVNLKLKMGAVNKAKINNAISTLKEYSNNKHLHYYLDTLQSSNSENKLTYDDKYIESSFFYKYTWALRTFTNKEATELANSFLSTLHEIDKDYRIYEYKIEYHFRGHKLFRYKAPKDFDKKYMENGLNSVEIFIRDFKEKYN